MRAARWLVSAVLFLAFAPLHGETRRIDPSSLAPHLEALATHEAMAPKKSLSPEWAKVAGLIREDVARRELLPAAEAARRSGPLLRTRADGALRVAIHLTVAGDDERALLAAAGFEETFAGVEHRFVEGWLPADSVLDVARLGFVTTIRPAYPPFTSTGSVLSQGDAIHRASNARTQFGVNGAGVKVGVISDSVDGLSTAVAAGDLPAGVQVLKAGTGAGEGTAMLEIVHDLAPGAPLAFYGPDTSGDMVAGIQALADAGAKVIVDDLTFFDQPHFEEGPIAAKVNEVAAAGVVYATSAGNFAASTGSDRGHYEATFAPGGALIQGLHDVHLFAPGNAFQQVDVLPGRVGVVFLQWGNVFGQAGDDYDIYAFDAGSGVLIGQGADQQDGDDLPMEAIGLDNRGSGQPLSVLLVIDRFSGAGRPLEIYYSGISNIEFATAAGSIAGHANASGALTVASINAGDPGNDTAADYSSRGPCDIRFPAAELRAKPDVTGIDGVAVTGAAGFPSPFFGTSAAAPHVAAIAALLLDSEPALTAAQVRQRLRDTAIDFGTAGFDFVFGHGRVDAFDALDANPGGGGGTAPVVSGFAADLVGNSLNLTATISDADGDADTGELQLLDGGLQEIATSGSFPLGVDGKAATAFSVSFTGLGGFPTARMARLIATDAAANDSAPVTADFSLGDPGGPAILVAKYSKSSKVLKVTGTGLLGAPAVEINGVLFPGLVNKKATIVKAKGKMTFLGLARGPNRVRVLNGGKTSNIFVVVIP